MKIRTAEILMLLLWCILLTCFTIIGVQRHKKEQELIALEFVNFCYEYGYTTPSHAHWIQFQEVIAEPNHYHIQVEEAQKEYDAYFLNDRKDSLNIMHSK